MDIKEVKDFLGEDWIAVQERISDVLRSDIDLLNKTNESILSHSGKNLRPLLSLLIARLCGGVNDATVRYASAAELLHNATLLHDDVADSSDCRRGVPTLQSLMGPSISVLVGDFWLVKAMDLILIGNSQMDTRVMRVFSKTLGDLAKGEMLQLQKASSGDTTETDYLKIIYNKTASLFEASCMSAAISASASSLMEDAAVRYAVALGLAFQIQDDILDYSGTDSVGKPLGVDILEGKITMPLLGALKNAPEEDANRIRKAVVDIKEHPETKNEVLAFVERYSGLEYARKQLDSYVEDAVKALEIFPMCQERSILESLAYFSARRIK